MEMENVVPFEAPRASEDDAAELMRVWCNLDQERQSRLLDLARDMERAWTRHRVAMAAKLDTAERQIIEAYRDTDERGRANIRHYADREKGRRGHLRMV